LGFKTGTVARDAIQFFGVRKVGLPAKACVDDELLIHAPIVLRDQAAFEPTVVIKQAAALGEIDALAKDEVGESVSGDGAAEAEKAGLKKGISLRSAQVIDLAAEVQFMAATVEGDHFSDLPVVAIKNAGMARIDIEKSIDVDAFHSGRAGRRDDIDARILKSEGRTGERSAFGAVIAEPTGEQQIGRSVIRVVDRDGLNRVGRPVAIGGKDVAVGGRDVGIMSVLRVEVTAAEMVLAGDVIKFRHELLVGLVGRRPEERELAIRTIGARNMLQEELRGPADGDLVAGERLTSRWVLKDSGNIGEVAGTLLVGGHEGDAWGDGGTQSGALPGAEEEELVMNDGAARSGAELMALLRIGCLGKEIACIDSAVADKLEKVTMELIGAGFGDNVDDNSSVAVFARHVIELDTELLNGVGIREG